jgi:hypothetical protein
MGQYPPMFDSAEHLLNTYSRVTVRQPFTAVAVAHSTGDFDAWWNDDFAWSWMNLVAGLVRGDVCAVNGFNELVKSWSRCTVVEDTEPAPGKLSVEIIALENRTGKSHWRIALRDRTEGSSKDRTDEQHCQRKDRTAGLH